MATSCWRPELLDRVVAVLRCPDDHAHLHAEEGHLACQFCRRRFQVSEEGIIDLLPAQPVQHNTLLNNSYMMSYYQDFYVGARSQEGKAWGSEENAPELWSKRRMRQVKKLLPLICERPHTHLCDLSAGAGLYTIAYSGYYTLVLHCDLSMVSLKYVAQKAKASGISNLIPIRADYFSPPFRHSLDVVLCLDSLIRGNDHEIRLLHAVRNTLAGDGTAIVDFHNWWHNPFRRVGLLKDNFVGNHSYSRRQAESLLKKAGIAQFDYLPFHQEVEPKALLADTCEWVIPATRLVYTFGAVK